MKIILFLIFFFSLGCSQNFVNQKIGNLNFSENISMEQFKTRLIEYSKKNPYPNINE